MFLRTIIFFLILSIVSSLKCMEHKKDLDDLTIDLSSLSLADNKLSLNDLPLEIIAHIFNFYLDSNSIQELLKKAAHIERVSPLFKDMIKKYFPLNPYNKISFNKTLLHFGLSVNDRCLLRGGETILHTLAKNDRDLFYEIFLKLGSDPFRQDNFNATSLEKAPAQNKAWSNIKTTLTSKNKSINNNSLELKPKRTLFKFLKQGNLEKFINKIKKEHINIIDTTLNDSLLHFLVRAPYITGLSEKACQKLLSLGINIDIVNKDDHTPLFLAVNFNNLAMVKKLTDAGANINKPLTPCRISPFFQACKLGHTEIVDFFLTKGAHINQVTVYNETPLFIACENNHITIVKLLLKHKPDISIAVKPEPFTAFLISCEKGNFEVINLLVEHGVNIHENFSNEEITGLHLATFHNYCTIVEYLLIKGVNVNAQTKNGFTALMGACTSNKVETAKILLKYKANVDIQTHTHYESALHIACKNGNTQTVKILLEHGASLELKTKDGKTPLEIASNDSRSDIQALFQQFLNTQKKQ